MVQQMLTFYELDLGLNHVVRKYNEPMEDQANLLIAGMCLWVCVVYTWIRVNMCTVCFCSGIKTQVCCIFPL